MISKSWLGLAGEFGILQQYRLLKTFCADLLKLCDIGYCFYLSRWIVSHEVARIRPFSIQEESVVVIANTRELFVLLRNSVNRMQRQAHTNAEY